MSDCLLWSNEVNNLRHRITGTQSDFMDYVNTYSTMNNARHFTSITRLYWQESVSELLPSAFNSLY